MTMDNLQTTVEQVEEPFIKMKDEEQIGDGRPKKGRTRIKQSVISLCAPLLCIPFGLMLGWPSPTYPYLTSPDSVISVSLDLSAMIAGFLMVGNSLGTPFSSQYHFGTKFGIVISTILITVGWIIMWQATDIYCLLGSRLVTGLGSGYGNGQLKTYLHEICDVELAARRIKLVNFYTLFGLVLAFIVGPFISFRQFSIFSLIASSIVLVISLFLPTTPLHLLRKNKVDEAKDLIRFLRLELNVEEEIIKTRNETNNYERMSFADIVKNKDLRKNFVIFTLLIFFQQFSGMPSTIVYCQILFERSGCPDSKYCAILYIVVFCFSTVNSVYFTQNMDKKKLLLLSTFGVCITLSLQIIVIIFDLNSTFWNYTSVVIMLIFIVVHTIGLGNVIPNIIPKYFPKSAKTSITNFYVIVNSLLALIITKIFQVMFTHIHIYSPFCLFLAVAAFGFIFIFVFISRESFTILNLNNTVILDRIESDKKCDKTVISS